jgi:hypothetical protein
MTSKAIRSTLLMCCGCLIGCGANPPAVETPPSIDEQVLAALDHYNPGYKLDADGHVMNINVDGRHVLPSALDELGKLKEVRGISLYAVPLTDDSLAKLHGCTKLRTLGLGGTPISDRALVHLEKLQDLQHVWLPKARVSTEGVAALKTALPSLSVHFQ